MTRLKELRLHGFKTFADPTRFVFERGVTAVIGPNGSGKSNMADAVRWVLGEQSNRSLRTRRADDVIFAGSEGRRPQGMAEAILTLDNSDRWLPTDFTEVSIGRRAYRSGEAEYLINGARARLKDVVDLLGGGRLGANELVVVGQGTVDAALSLRPEERRQLFEDAAGVKNLQVRKNEALARLAGARENLIRVGDLVSELRPQVRRLAVQAQHQEQHDALGRRARALIVEAHGRRLAVARGSLGEARRGMAVAEAALEVRRGEEAAGREAIAAAEERYWSAEASARKAAERREASREALIRAEATADAVGRRQADLVDATAQVEAELPGLAAALDAKPEMSDPDAEAKWRAARDAEQAWRAAAAALDELDREALAAEQALGAARAQAHAWIADAARHDETAARADARRERVERELQTARTDAESTEAALESTWAELAAAELGEAEAAATWHGAGLAAEEAELVADAGRSRATALAERIGGLGAELATLHERAEGGRRLGTVLAAAGWRVLMEEIDPPEAAWAAIEALIGGDLAQALVWRDSNVLDHVAEARGSAHLLAGGTSADGAQEAARRADAFAAVNATRTLAEWIGSANGPRLFRRAAVAPDLEALLRGWSKLPAGWCAVTADGDLADSRGLVVVRGRQEAAAGEAARLHARHRELAALLERLEVEQAHAGQAAAQALVASAATRREREAARQGHDEAQRQAGRARTAHLATADEMARAHELEQALGAELDEVRATIIAGGATTSAKPPVAARLDRLAALAADAHRRRALAAADRDQRRSAWQAAQSVADATDSGLGDARYQRAILVARSDQLASALRANQDALATLGMERATAAAEVALAAGSDRAAGELRATADAERDRLRADLLEHERARGGAESQAADLEHLLQGAALEMQRLEDTVVAIGRERDLALESLPPDAGEVDPGSPGGAALADLAAASLDMIDGEIGRARRTLAQIGSVNPFAVEEHRDLAARLQSLAAQDADLGAAIASTGQLIGRLDAEIVDQFNAAFVAIGAKFDEFFRLLFGGGSASLQMGHANDGDAAGGIEIAVRPPGRRLQRLAMLSGGERALAGVALLFAMLSVNPVPFCILDEVDAALDEANIGRFAAALRQLAQQIDFVVITHNRATIEVADTIYGVTMTDAAVSRLLSLRLADLPVEVSVG